MADKSVMFVVTALMRAGAETQVRSLAMALRRRRWDVTVVSLIEPEAYVEELRAQGVDVRCLEMRPGHPNPLAILRLRSLLQEKRPSVVHANLVDASLIVRIARLCVRMPVVVCTAHSVKPPGRWRWRLFRMTDRLCDLTTNVSEAAVQNYIDSHSARPDRMRFVPNGLDARQFHASPDTKAALRASLGLGDAFAWLAVGRIEPAKDYPNMLRAFSHALSQRPDATLLIAGQGSLEAEVKALAQSLEISHRVRFLGLRRDIPQLMAAADGYLMSSAWEGLPMVLLEASAAGLPIVTTDVGGNREVVMESRSGHLVPSGDPEALADAMLRVMNLPPEQRAAMGQTARAFVCEHYDIEKVVDQWESIYRDLLGEKGLHGLCELHSS